VRVASRLRRQALADAGSGAVAQEASGKVGDAAGGAMIAVGGLLSLIGRVRLERRDAEEAA